METEFSGFSVPLEHSFEVGKTPYAVDVILILAVKLTAITSYGLLRLR